MIHTIARHKSITLMSNFLVQAVDSPSRTNILESANLDVLRSFAVLSVYFGHLIQVLFDRPELFVIQNTGVLVFFVHTSLVLMLSIERLQVSTKSFVIPFYVRRLFRIYPLSITVVIFLTLFKIPHER